jgi:hypothetical protein
MEQEEKGSDELLGVEAIEQEQGRVFVEELALGQEEMDARNAEPEDDGEDDEFDDDTPPDSEEHAEYDELPPPPQEI